MPYDPERRNGWARGLIHFHTRFSDGWAHVRHAGEIAVQSGYDFLVVTDHLRNLKLFTHRTLQEYVQACDDATAELGIPIIPGGEMEVHWNDSVTSDFSEAHTLCLCIRPLVAAQDFDWTTPDTDPFAHWPDPQSGSGTIKALQERLRLRSSPVLASHQFQHSVISLDPNEQPDFRYDLAALPGAMFFDFFYSGGVDLNHEAEDILLVSRYAATDPAAVKGVYASCDFHMGPQTIWPRLETIPIVSSLVSYLPGVWAWLVENIAPHLIRHFGEAEAAPFPKFADEQLSHATYVYLGDRACTERDILECLRDGRTCVTRGRAEFANLDPFPSFTVVRQAPVQIHLSLPVSYSEPRPRIAIVLRDGRPVRWEPYAIEESSLHFTYIDQQPPAGLRSYQVYVPSKFLSSPIIFA